MFQIGGHLCLVSPVMLSQLRPIEEREDTITNNTIKTRKRISLLLLLLRLYDFRTE